MTQRLLNKNEMPPGTLAEAGTAEEVNTGSWRTYLPLTDFENCSHCLRCWIFCPDGAVVASEGKKQGIDMKHCKGCGICATECPQECVRMRLGSEISRDSVNTQEAR